MEQNQVKPGNLAAPIPVFTSLYTILMFRIGFIVLFLYLLKQGVYLPAFFTLLLIAVIETASFWSRLGFRKLRVETRLNPYRLFPGDEISFSIQYANEKRLPVFLSWSQPLPPGFALADQQAEPHDPITGSTYLGAYAAGKGHCRLTAEKRGYYHLPGLYLYSRDIFGWFYRRQVKEQKVEIIVYPQLLPIEELCLQGADFNGLDRDKRPFLFDPVMFAGLRDYTPDMPARFIHWKATAHQDRLLAKIIEPSAGLQILIAIDAYTFICPEADEALFEKALSAAATIAVWADCNKIPFGIAANIPRKELAGPMILPVNRNLDQGRLVLESLARAELAFCGNLEDILSQMSPDLPWGTILILIQKGGNRVAAPSRFRRVISYPIMEG
jgi:uncharacterized protein (DUF58 family)